jgi:5-methylthioadenosine/S-adenosylhomocysteine deaminase
LVHGNYLNEDEIGEVAGSGAALVHCPASHRFFGHRLFPWSRIKKAGIPLLLGTDSAATGGGPDLAATLKLSLESSDARPEDLWEAASLGGARALGLDSSLGKLDLGYSADFVLISLNKAKTENLAESLLEGKVAASFMGGVRF